MKNEILDILNSNNTTNDEAAERISQHVAKIVIKTAIQHCRTYEWVKTFLSRLGFTSDQIEAAIKSRPPSKVDQILEFMKQNPGPLSAIEIGEGCGSRGIHHILKKLTKNQEISKQGSKYQINL